jgi:hypothetical protein
LLFIAISVTTPALSLAVGTIRQRYRVLLSCESSFALEVLATIVHLTADFELMNMARKHERDVQQGLLDKYHGTKDVGLEPLTKPIDKSTAGDGGCQSGQSEMSIKRALETNAQLAEAGEPSVRGSTTQRCFAEPVVPLDATASNPGSDTTLAHRAKSYPLSA